MSVVYGVDPTYTTGFRTKPFDVILSDLITRAKEYFGEDIDLRSTSPLYKFIEVCALEIANQWSAMERTWDSMWIRTSTGQALDYLADDAGLSRQDAQYATGQVTFTVSAAVTIPAGTTIRTAYNIWFVTDSDLVFAAPGSDTVTITAQSSGETGNVGAADISEVDPAIANVTSVTNSNSTTGGSDRETDEELRQRLLNASRSYRSATMIASQVGNLEGIRNAAVRENFPTEYQFTVYVAPDTPGAMTPGHGSYDATLFQSVVTVIETYRSICSDPIITEASSVNINITGSVNLLSTFTLAGINTNAFTNINGYIQGLGLGDNVLWNEIIYYIMDVAGVYDISNVQINVLGEGVDQTIADDEIAVLNSVTLT